MTIYHKSLTLLVFSLFMSLQSIAFASEVKEAEGRVIAVTSNVVRLLEQNKAVYSSNIDALNAMVRREILPLIDFDAMSKLTLGKFWRLASPQQRQRFINAYREMLVRSYAKTMLDYSGAVIRPGRSVPNQRPGYALIRTVVTPKGGSPIAANYSVRKNSGQWKAYNVEIAGVNLITNFRTNFTREASQKGLEALIARIERTGK